MGMRIADIHTPSVGDGHSASADGASIQELITQKDKLEGELKALGGVLDSHNVDMHTSLTTSDGYPRSDLDIAQIRTTRARIIHLRNDHKALMKRIEVGLVDHFANAAEEESLPISSTPTNANNASVQSTSTGASTSSSAPAFAIVNTVSPTSPAATAGLQPEDRIVQFGDANWLNHEKLSRVALVVGRNEGRPIEVIVTRESAGRSRLCTLSLVPRRDWGGRGSLGCHLKEL